MMFYTHVVFSLLIGLYFMDYFFVSSPLVFFSFLVLFSLVLDIDSTRSFVGRKFWFISWFVALLFKHRRIIHSVGFVLAVSLVLYFIAALLGIGFFIAAGSHLVLDSLTRGGIYPIYPLKFKLKGVIKTGGIVEHLFFVLVLVLLVVVVIT